MRGLAVRTIALPLATLAPHPCPAALWGRLPEQSPCSRAVGVKWVHMRTAPAACGEELPVTTQSSCVWESALSRAPLAHRNSKGHCDIPSPSSSVNCKISTAWMGGSRARFLSLSTRAPWPDQSVLWAGGAVLGVVGCAAASLTSIHYSRLVGPTPSEGLEGPGVMVILSPEWEKQSPVSSQNGPLPLPWTPARVTEIMCRVSPEASLSQREVTWNSQLLSRVETPGQPKESRVPRGCPWGWQLRVA